MRTYDATELEFLLSINEIKDLLVLSRYRHGMAIVLDWLIIISMICAWVLYPYWWLYPFIIMVIGGRMHGLAVLMHDASHYRFLKSKKWNDAITNYLSMYPLFISIEDYRWSHLAHHNKLNTLEDPDWKAKIGRDAFAFPMKKKDFLMRIGSYLFIYQGVLDLVWIFKRFGSKNKKAERITYIILMFAAITFFGVWKEYILLWVVPYLTFFSMFLYIRSVAEHFGGLDYNNLLGSSRTIKVSFWESFFLSPHNVNYHLDHHLYPAVPFYHLDELNRRLELNSGYKNESHITYGYITGLLAEISSGAVNQ